MEIKIEYVPVMRMPDEHGETISNEVRITEFKGTLQEWDKVMKRIYMVNKIA